MPKPLLQKLTALRRETLVRIRQQRLPGWERAVANAQRHYDQELDRLLRLHVGQQHPLAHPAAAEIVVNRLKEYHGRYYDLCAYTVLSNHVHMELDFSIQLPEEWDTTTGTVPRNYVNVPKVMNLIKGGSARQVNTFLGRTGKPLWTKRYRDRFIRDERHLHLACTYTRLNPVAAKLVDRWEDHPFTGGLTAMELADRRFRRVYPDPGLWLSRLREYDRHQGR